jgi:hypothetical protein
VPENGSDTETEPDATDEASNEGDPVSEETRRKNPNTIFVAQDGDDTNRGTREDPVRSIQQGLNQAQPGATIQVQPGRYQPEGWVQTVRAGTAEKPITITGPSDAVFNGGDPFIINHSHVHLTGMTFDGLVDPDNPDDPDSYSWGLLEINGALHDRVKNGDHRPDSVSEDNYLRDIVVKPHAVGNCTRDFIKVNWSKNVEIGEFRIIGPAGVDHLKGDRVGHNSEIIYLGNPPDREWAPDLTSDVHIHHIDNSSGYPHSELVDCKTGTSNVIIEYCTNAGGSAEATTDDNTESAIHIGGTDITVRWNVLSGGSQAGIEIDSDIAAAENPPDGYADGGTNNAIYGNRLVNNGGRAIQFAYPDRQGQQAQRTICGNEYNGESHGDPDRACSSEMPESDEIGHMGGESPWA